MRRPCSSALFAFITLAGLSSAPGALAWQQNVPTIVAEAPPLVWPSWLVHIEGTELKVQQALDQSKNNCLQATYYTHLPMTRIGTFYEDLFKANDYRIVT